VDEDEGRERVIRRAERKSAQRVWRRNGERAEQERDERRRRGMRIMESR